MSNLMPAALGLACTLAGLPAEAQGPLTLRVSVASNGTQGNGHSTGQPALARGGGAVAFMSVASNLVVGDTNGTQDVFVHELGSGATTRESVDSSGGQAHANSNSTVVGISADGRFVVFCSDSPALVVGDSNQEDDVFLRDRQSGTTIRASVGNAGQQGDRRAADPSVSDDGRFVAFYSYATNLVVPDTNGTADIFVRDVVAGTTTIVDVDAQGVQSNQGAFNSVMSGNGRFVAFQCGDNLLPPGTLYDQVFVRDLLLGITSLESVSSTGVIGDSLSFPSALSSDGRFLTFGSLATNLVNGDTLGFQDGFLRDRTTGTTQRVTVGYNGAESNDNSNATDVSDDGRFVLFGGQATNILPFDASGISQDCWMRDLSSGDNVSIGVDSNGQPVYSLPWGCSSDGHISIFSSSAENVVPGDNNGFQDIFVRIAPFEAPIFFCTPKLNSLGCTPQIASFGNSSASQTSGFVISASSERNRRAGILFYSASGRAAIPFAGGTLCLATVHRNTPNMNAGGTPAPVNDCTGSYSLDMNAFAAGLLGGPPLPALSTPGMKVQVQWWSRDPGFVAPNAIGLTGGIEYTVGS